MAAGPQQLLASHTGYINSETALSAFSAQEYAQAKHSNLPLHWAHKQLTPAQLEGDKLLRWPRPVNPVDPCSTDTLCCSLYRSKEGRSRTQGLALGLCSVLFCKGRRGNIRLSTVHVMYHHQADQATCPVPVTSVTAYQNLLLPHSKQSEPAVGVLRCQFFPIFIYEICHVYSRSYHNRAPRIESRPSSFISIKRI